jgi:hypothetical protein
MRIKINLAALKETHWSEYLLRFLFGGAVTIGTGLLAKKFGPALGGLFLAFPAIFPAGVTLVQKHESEKKKHRLGIVDHERGRKAAALEARGAAMGSIGLAVFAGSAWMLLTRSGAPWSLLAALAAWVAISIFVWRIGKLRHRVTR